ncbi:MAG TPA: 6,7-dimethyl-8-ribityllumazine synthase [Bryobacteraceae bacterium]|nr:6,7-dimethyl-8-ribityllumazine synthase [Bryobacteraceae bacterium]
MKAETRLSHMSPVIEGKLEARGLKFAIVVGRFNSFITDRLLDGALDALRRTGVDPADITIVKVPGAWEIPLTVKTIAQQGNRDAIIALSAVIRGETSHFDHVAGGAANGIARISIDAGIPIAFGVLTTNTVDQAVDRAGGKSGNKGFDAAMTAIEMANLLRQLRNPA